MILLVMGVLAGAGAFGVLANSGPLLLGLALVVAAPLLIIVGAVGLGASLRPPFTHQSEVDTASYPAQLEGHLDPKLSRWMWLVKWFLAIPHFVVLVVLWIAFLVVTVVAALAILFTGRYPASLFQFAVGVLRWNWRVAFYANGVMGSDRYPPFTLAHTDYPATFDVSYPEKLSHWKVLVKSWLFALPHLLIVALLTGGGWASSTGNGVALLGLLVLIAAVILLFTGVYRLGLFDLLMGMHRWIYRVVAYVALMRDDYPPFRLDQGPLEAQAQPTVP
jgi:hypothetical protein